MTLAWYGHLKYASDRALPWVILFSWGIVFFEYVLMVPANRMGYTIYEFSGFQLKILQEAITILVFTSFAILVLKENLKWNYAVGFVLILLAVYFAFGFSGETRKPH